MHALDNIVWQALTTRQTEFAEACGEARRFIPEVTSLGAVREPNAEGYASLAGLVSSGGTVLLALADPFEAVAGWEHVVTVPGLQMVWHDDEAHNRRLNSAGDLPPIIKLGLSDSPEMLELATLTKPGPFGTRTYELGNYLGIRSEGKLVAMAGERMKVPGYTEVSAVCTHPEHTGKGYAGGLTIQVMEGIRSRGEVPFLHVRRDNLPAVALYQRLGFRTRTVVYFTLVRKN
jgi:ribosomal protein S18 acetylase RimI-like enzyme